MTAEQAEKAFDDWKSTEFGDPSQGRGFIYGYAAGEAAAVKEEAGKLVFATIDYEHRIEELEREAAAQRPIPVSDDDPQPPPVDVRVLGWFGDRWQITMWSGCMWAYNRIPSFWLPLPAAPERT